MKKSIAKVEIKDRSEPIVLDDYEYADVYLIVGALASRFHPDEWTEEAKPIKEERGRRGRRRRSKSPKPNRSRRNRRPPEKSDRPPTDPV